MEEGVRGEHPPRERIFTSPDVAPHYFVHVPDVEPLLLCAPQTLTSRVPVYSQAARLEGNGVGLPVFLKIIIVLLYRYT
jgi:hypothetical protein